MMKEKTQIQIIRERKGIAFMEMLKLANIPKSTYYRYEQGQRTPDAKTAIRIADALGVKNYKEFRALWQRAID